MGDHKHALEREQGFAFALFVDAKPDIAHDPMKRRILQNVLHKEVIAALDIDPDRMEICGRDLPPFFIVLNEEICLQNDELRLQVAGKANTTTGWRLICRSFHWRCMRMECMKMARHRK